jgi:hypothetical protein
MVMAFCLNRRFTALVTAILFAVSVAGHGFASSHAGMKAMESAAASDMQSPITDSGCGGNEGDGMACFALCASAVAVLPESAALPITITVTQPLSLAELPLLSRDNPPDPAPPRSIVLS